MSQFSEAASSTQGPPSKGRQLAAAFPADSSLSTTNLYDLLKVVAIVSMIGDHIGRYLFHETAFLTLPGRIAAPVFLFLVGFNLSNRTPFSLWASAVIAQICFCVLGYPVPANILWSIALARLLLRWIKPERWSPTFQEILLVGFAFLAPFSAPFFDYGTAGFLWILAGRFMRLGGPLREQTLSWAGIVILALNWVSYMGLIAHLCLILIYLCTTLVLSRVSPFTSLSGLTTPAIRVLSRNALTIYALHLIAITIVALFILKLAPLKFGADESGEIARLWHLDSVEANSVGKASPPYEGTNNLGKAPRLTRSTRIVGKASALRWSLDVSSSIDRLGLSGKGAKRIGDLPGSSTGRV